MQMPVKLVNQNHYNEEEIYRLLPDELFSIIQSGNTVVLKPNWVLECHQEKPDEWEQVITHPTVTTAVLRKVVNRLNGRGKIIITDGPELNANFDNILALHPVAYWKKITGLNNIVLEIIDLREELYIQDKNVTIKKVSLPGDPGGKVMVNLLNDLSEFYNHVKSAKGYFAGGSDIQEANSAHNGSDNLYSVSKTVIACDVFINIPKLKTHKKSGITCSLKNLVGINTYRNYLPHNSIGTPMEGGDQFPNSYTRSRIETALMPSIHQYILKRPLLSRFFSPIITLGKRVFGDNKKTIRGGSWYGNDTIWRMILDINKILFYSDTEGNMVDDPAKMKKYITVVDAIIAGEGYGPKSPDAKRINMLVMGTNPVSVDAVCARLMGFDPIKIPSIRNSFNIRHFPIINQVYKDIIIEFEQKTYNLSDFPKQCIADCNPHPGWSGHIEMQ
jgi:uncharacterized protein (DUF362 family)